MVNTIIVQYLIPLIPLFFLKDSIEIFLLPKRFLITIFSSFLIGSNILKEKVLNIINPKVFLSFLVYITLNTIFISKLPLKSFSSLILFFVFYILIGIDFKYNERKFVHIINFSAIMISIYAYFQFFQIDPFFLNKDYSDYQLLNGVFSTLGNKNFVAEFLASVVIFNLCYGYRRLINILYVSVVFLVLTKTTVFFLILFLIYFFIKDIKDKKSLMKWLLVLAVIISISYLSAHKVNIWQVKTLFDFSIKNSLSQRLYIWKTTFEVIKNYFMFGTGLGLFEEAFLYYQNECVFDFDYNYFCDAKFAHNEVLQIFSELGIVGVTLIFLLFLPIIKYFFSSKYRPLLLYLIFQSMFSFPMRLPSVIVLLFFVINQAVINGKVPSKKLELNLFKRTIGIYVCILFIAFSSLYFVSGIYMKQGMKKGTLAEKQVYFKKAIKINPGWYLPYYNAGIFYYNKGNYTESLQLFNRALDYSKRPLIFFYRGLSFIGVGENDMAIKDLEKFVEFYPVSYKAYYNLYMLYSQKDDDISKEKAIHYYEIYDSLLKAVNSEH